MTDEADSSVVLAELQVIPFRESNNQRLSPWGRPFSCSPDPVKTSVMVSRQLEQVQLVYYQLRQTSPFSVKVWGTGKTVVYGYSSIQREGSSGYSVAATVSPPHRKYFYPGLTPPRPKQPVVWGTGKQVVYGYRSIQRKGA